MKMIDFFKPKFKVRVKHYCEGGIYYTIEYSNSIFFDCWISLDEYCESPIANLIGYWDIKLELCRDAIEFAKTIKTIEDVENYNETEKLKENINYLIVKEYLTKIAPVEIENII